MQNKAARVFILLTVAIDAIGVGLIMPVIPALLLEIGSKTISDAAFWGGILSFIYAINQFLFGPILGNLSDRYGRRPILLSSLTFMALSYFLLASASSILIIIVARLISGITGATYSVASAYIADTSDKGTRSSGYGLMAAAFSTGFTLGPVIGGFLGEFGPRVPFYLAGALAMLNALFGLIALPESLVKNAQDKLVKKDTNPLRAFKGLNSRLSPPIKKVLLVTLLYASAVLVFPAIWSYFAIEKFEWSTKTIGLSLAYYSLLSLLVQAVLLKKLIDKVGERNTIYFGMVAMISSLIFMFFVESGTSLFLFLPIIALGNLVSPTLQGILADQVSDERQGEIQGILGSVLALATAISPLIMATLFSVFTSASSDIYLPGAPFLLSCILVLFSLTLFTRMALPSKNKEAES